jgi:hypothetical protein
MKLKSVAKYLNTDDLTLSIGNEIASFEGTEVARALDTYGDCKVVQITPTENALDIELKM